MRSGVPVATRVPTSWPIESPAVDRERSWPDAVLRSGDEFADVDPDEHHQEADHNGAQNSVVPPL